MRVDRTAITCPSVARFAAVWLSKAELLGQKRKIGRFISALKGKPSSTLRKHRKVRVTLQQLQDAGLLNLDKVDGATVEFIQSLGV